MPLDPPGADAVPPLPPIPRRGQDGGPLYAETPLDPWAADSPWPAEPYNTATATIFIGLALYWAWVVRGQWRRFAFLTAAVPILLTGGIGGTLYHATRTQRAYFLMDVIPIQLLGLAAAGYMTWRLSRELGHVRVFATAAGLLATFFALTTVLFRTLDPTRGNLPVNISYALLATIILSPILVVLVRTQFRHGSWVLVGLIAFAIAWFCRLVDSRGMSQLPMGTHWLWHIFGAAATQALAVYFYRLEAHQLPPPAAPPERS